MNKYEIKCYFSKDDSFNIFMETKSLQVAYENIEKWIFENNFYRSSFDDSAKVYNMGKVIYFEVNEIK